eukprot:scaffold176151_cov13-Tisochrysis_lutea.AAC.1
MREGRQECTGGASKRTELPHDGAIQETRIRGGQRKDGREALAQQRGARQHEPQEGSGRGFRKSAVT